MPKDNLMAMRHLMVNDGELAKTIFTQIQGWERILKPWWQSILESPIRLTGGNRTAAQDESSGCSMPRPKMTRMRFSAWK
jgi:hypothetical protein